MCAHLMRLWLGMGYRAAWRFRDVSRDAKGLGTSSKLRCYVGLRIVTLSKNLIKYENRYSQIFNIVYRELHATYMEFFFFFLMTRPANKVTISLPAPTRPAGYETTRASLPCPHETPSQAILEICLRRCGLSVHGPALWTVPGSSHFYKVHGRGSFPSKADGNPHSQPHSQLDDWFILAQSGAELLSHRSLLLSHLECLGIRVKFAKSALSPSQWILFLGTVFDSA